MASVRYVGPHDEVLVPLPLGGEEIVARDGILNTSDEHAASLCEQVPNWRPFVEAKAETKATSSPEKKKEEK